MRRTRSTAGLYLRTDFWAPIMSGGSYGHTCYVAKELAAVTDRFVVPAGRSRFTLLDDFGVRQVVMDPPPTIVRRRRDRQRVRPLLPDRQDRVRGAAARVHLRAARASATTSRRC